MTNVIGAIVRLIQLINVTWSFVAYSVKTMGILSQHAPILTASAELEKGVLSLMIILALVLVTVLLSKDINKGVMSWFSLPKYGCIRFLHLLHIHVTDMNIRLPHLCQLYNYIDYTASLLLHVSWLTASLLLHDSLPRDSDMFSRI